MEEGFVRARKQGAPSLHYATQPARASTLANGEPKAVLAVVHGYADHALRYTRVMEFLAESGIASVAIDMRGHGTSEGPRGACKVFSEFLDDFSELPALLDAVSKSAPKFLFGHSFGGLVSIHGVLSGLASSYRGVLLSSPFLGLAFEPPKLKLLAGEIASKLMPGIGLPSGLKGADVTHDPEIARAYDEDPRVFKNANARWFTETWQAQKRAMELAPTFKKPLYMTFGDADKIANFNVGKAFCDRAGSEDKTFVPLAGLYHEALNEPSYKETVTGMIAFIERVLATPAR
jgi:alpha-beta hydrolase superfamily lysophospholipase